MTSRWLAGVTILAVAALALLWGGSVGREAAPARSADLTTGVVAACYDALPLDPAAASRRSRLLNAHVSGFGATARISLDDTTPRATTLRGCTLPLSNTRCSTAIPATRSAS